MGFKKAVFHDNDENFVPCYSSKMNFDLDHDFSSSLTDSFVTKYTYSGSGKFIGFDLTYSSQFTATKLIIDSDTIFDIVNSELDVAHTLDKDTLGLIWEPTRKQLLFYPRFPICFDTDVVIQSRKTSVPAATLDSYIVCIDKVT